jgi:hypothetical protein
LHVGPKQSAQYKQGQQPQTLLAIGFDKTKEGICAGIALTYSCKITQNIDKTHRKSSSLGMRSFF